MRERDSGAAPQAAADEQRPSELPPLPMFTDGPGAHAELARMSRLYAALSQVNQAIVWTASRSELLRKVCRILVEQGGLRLAWIGWHDPQSHELVPVAAWGDTLGYLETARVFTDERPEGRGPSGISFREGRPYICNQMLDDPATAPWRGELERRGFRASAVFPVREKGAVCATLSVYSTEPSFFRQQEIALLVAAAADLSFALDNFAREDQRRRAEESAQRERVFSDTMIESMPGILYFYDQQGRFLRWNRNFEVVSGCSGEEIATMSPLDFFADEDREAVGRAIEEVFAGGESFIEARFRRKDGRVTPYFFTGKRVVFDKSVCLVGVGIDISERKRAETALRELNESLEQKVGARTVELSAALLRAEAADRVKSSFLATMSHELRTPLNSIIGFTGIVLQGLAGPLTAEQSKQLGMVRGSARHLLELINDVLDISKIEAEQLEVLPAPFDLRASIERVVSTMTPLAEKKGLALAVALPPTLPEMVSDRRRVEQILLNLLNNALKFTDRGGITLTVELVPSSLPVGGAPTPALRLCVADTGIGIRPEDLAKLFQPFRQIDTGLDRRHEGTGLGLAICRRLAGLLQGEISAESEWGKGSALTVTLPLRAQRKVSTP